MRCQTCHAEEASTTLGCGVCGTPTGAPAVVPGARTYRLRGVGWAAAILVGLTVLFDLLIAFWPVVGGMLAERAMRDLDPDLATGAALFSALIEMVSLAPFIAAAVLVILWCYRARVNLNAFPGATPTLRTGWAITGWLVPIVSLIVPARVMAGIARDSLWRSSTPALVRIWFGSWLLYLYVGQIRTLTDNGTFDALPTTFEDPYDFQMHVDYYAAAVGPNLLVALLSVVAGASLIMLIIQVSAAQDARTGRGVPTAPVMPGMPIASA